MNIVKATRRFEDWLAQRTSVVKKDLRTKHQAMKSAVFPFLRATYYRWAELWPEVCPELAKGPRVLAVGDLHVENFGTWRDVEGRLIWGVNDFDEAYAMSFANDLVRLCVSAHLAAEAGHLTLTHKDICDGVLESYTRALKEGGCPFVLSENNEWLRDIAESELRDPVRFWKKMRSFPSVNAAEVPASAVDALEHLLPHPRPTYRIARRVAGLGSLGHARFVALADWNGGYIAREAKALVPSAAHFLQPGRDPLEILYQAILNRAVRCPDPFVRLCGRWIVRRLGPYCSRIELAALSNAKGEIRLLNAMGFETANIHLGTRPARKQILRELKKQKPKWLHRAALDMAKAVRSDWEDWKKSGYL
jgi:Uncharacterized protein conserved in bacteria (DUF2252)